MDDEFVIVKFNSPGFPKVVIPPKLNSSSFIFISGIIVLMENGRDSGFPPLTFIFIVSFDNSISFLQLKESFKYLVSSELILSCIGVSSTNGGKGSTI